MWVVQRFVVKKNHCPYWEEIDPKSYYAVVKNRIFIHTGSWDDAQKVADYLERESYDSQPHRVHYRRL